MPPLEVIPGAFSPLFSIIMTGELTPVAWVNALDAPGIHISGGRPGNSLKFEQDGIQGQIFHDASIEKLTLARAVRLSGYGQDAPLVIRLAGGSLAGNPVAFQRRPARAMRARYLDIHAEPPEGFSPDELRQALDMESLKDVIYNPQDLAALFGLGLRLAATLERYEPGWEVERYLTQPVVLAGYSAPACVSSGLPIAPDGLAPDWVPRLVPEINEPIPKKAATASGKLAVFLVESIQARGYSLPYLLMQPGNRLAANGRSTRNAARSCSWPAGGA